MSALSGLSPAQQLISRANLRKIWGSANHGDQPVGSASTTNAVLDNTDKLNMLEEVLGEVEVAPPVPSEMSQGLAMNEGSVADQAVTSVLAGNDQVSMSQQTSTSRSKEKFDGASAPIIESGGITYVEHEPKAEIPVEVEGFLKRVDNSADKLSQEIVLADANLATQNQKHPTQPVIVVPITPEMEKQAQFKSPKFSIVWLVEWSRKVIKKFLGQVIYKD